MGSGAFERGVGGCQLRCKRGGLDLDEKGRKDEGILTDHSALVDVAVIHLGQKSQFGW